MYCHAIRQYLQEWSFIEVCAPGDADRGVATSANGRSSVDRRAANTGVTTSMSSKAVHYAAGSLLGAGAAWLTASWFDPWQSALLVGGCLWGASAPDWLEISGRTFWGRRVSLIPHRRITHWMLGWCAVTAWVLLNLAQRQSFQWCIAAGFCLSALLHVLLDYRTPMSVPVIHPWRRSRRSNAP